MVALRAELDAVAAQERPGDRTLRAMLHDAIGRRAAKVGAGEAIVVRELLSAYNADPSFRPPLFDLVRTFERRRSLKNLGRLYDAEVKSATSPEEKAHALVDRAWLGAIELGELEVARKALDDAEAADPESALVPFVRELVERRAGDGARAEVAFEARVTRLVSPELRALGLRELGLRRLVAKRVEEAVAAFESAVRLRADARGFVLLAFAEEQRGGATAALAAWRRAAELATGEERAAYALEASAVARRSGAHADAVLAAREATEAAPDDSATWVSLEVAARAAGDAAALELATERLDASSEAASVGRLDAAELRGDAAEVDALLSKLAASGSKVAALLGRDAALRAGDVARFARSVVELHGDTSSQGAAANDAARALALSAERLLAFPRDRASRAEVDALAFDLFHRALAAFDRAGESASAHERSLVVRGACFAALGLGADATRGARPADPAHVSEAVRRLLAEPLESDERAMLSFANAVFGAPTEAELLALLEDVTAQAWSAPLVRVVASDRGHHRLAAEAHQRIAKGAEKPEIKAAHLAAAARCLVRAGDSDAALSVLARALTATPTAAYGRALAEGLLAKKGDPDAKAQFFAQLGGERAQRAEENASRVAQAVVAENQGDDDRAAELLLDIEGETPLEALLVGLRLAERRGATQEREIFLARLAVRDDAPAWALLEHAASLEVGSEASDRAIERLLERPEIGLEAQLLAATGTSSHRARAIELLAQHPLIELALGRSHRGELGALDEALAAVRRPERRPEDWVALADATDDPAAGRLFLLSALMQSVLAPIGESPTSPEPSLVERVRAEQIAKPTAATAWALYELADRRALLGERPAYEALDALGVYLTQRGFTPSVSAAYGRELVRTGRSDDALSHLRAAVEREPFDVGAWDTLRLAAREAQAFEDVVRAADHLASLVSGEAKAQLLEESAAVLMDELGDDAGAETRLRAALAVDGSRAIAYARLHDLLAERGDEAELLDLVIARTDATDDPDHLAPLFYEQARLYRTLGQLDDALAALENVLLLDDTHVGALALTVEIHVQRESWAEAVEALRSLAICDAAPSSQRRIARLGAAEFLDKRLGDRRGAIAELAEIKALGLLDRAVYERMAGIVVRMESPADGFAAVERAGQRVGATQALFWAVGSILAQRADASAFALPLIKKVVELDPDDDEARRLLRGLEGR